MCSNFVCTYKSFTFKCNKSRAKFSEAFDWLPRQSLVRLFRTPTPRRAVGRDISPTLYAWQWPRPPVNGGSAAGNWLGLTAIEEESIAIIVIAGAAGQQLIRLYMGSHNGRVSSGWRDKVPRSKIRIAPERNKMPTVGLQTEIRTHNSN